MLLGDFLITQQDGQTSLRKKIRRIGPNIAIGWTGNLFAAETALEHLGRTLGENSTRDEVEAALLGVDVSSMPGTVTLVGWVVDDGPTAFHWQSSYPTGVNVGDPWYVGSGGQLLETIRGPSGYSAVKGEDPRLHALDVATALMSDEARGKSLRRLQVGHAYELISWNEGRFDYIDDILYLTVRVEYDESGGVSAVKQLEPMFKYFTCNELSLVGIFENDEVSLHLVTPVGLREAGVNDLPTARALLNELVADDWAASSSTFYGVALDLRIPGYMGPIIPLVLRNSEQPSPPIITESSQSVEISLPDNLLVEMFKAIQRDQGIEQGI